MQGNLAPELQLAGGAPGIGVKPNFSESMENLSQKIQQFSVKRRQQIQDFEGVGGNSGSKTVFSNTIETKTPETIIAERTKGLDLVPHPTTQKQLSPKKMKELKQKIADRTITREEYESHIDAMADAALDDSCTETNPRQPMKQDVINIYKKLW